MGVVTDDSETPFSIPPAKLFKAIFLDGDTLIPKMLPEFVKSVEILEGDGGAGTIKVLNFGDVGLNKRVKQRVDELDKENLVYKYTIIEGDILNTDVLESISLDIKIEASGDGDGSVCKIRTTYRSRGDAQIKKECVKSGKEMAAGMFKPIEAFLHANPDY